MARNKYPEETYELILDVSTRLFFEKGYEKTSLQDIINELGGLTKGAIYYHFKSKEEILIAVVGRYTSENGKIMSQIRDDDSLSGKEKIEKMFRVSANNPNQKKVFSVTPNLMDNPKLLMYYLKMVEEEIVPDYIVPIIKEGAKDGSIKTDYPEELADLILILTDVWINPIIFTISEAQMIRRIRLINEILKPYGIDLISKEMERSLKEYRMVIDRKENNE